MYCIRVDRRKRRFSNTMTSCIGSSSPFVTYDSKTLRVDADFFKSGEKNLRFRKYPATCGWSNTIQKRYVWMQIFFKYGEKNLRFRKYPAACGQGLSQNKRLTYIEIQMLKHLEVGHGCLFVNLHLLRFLPKFYKKKCVRLHKPLANNTQYCWVQYNAFVCMGPQQYCDLLPLYAQALSV